MEVTKRHYKSQERELLKPLESQGVIKINEKLNMFFGSLGINISALLKERYNLAKRWWFRTSYSLAI